MSYKVFGAIILFFFRLFFNDPGHLEYNYPLQIQSIRIISNYTNLEKQINAITALDNILSNNVRSDNSIQNGNNYGSIISELMNAKRTTPIFHPYLYKTFAAFIAHKKEIKIRLFWIDRCVFDTTLENLLFYSIKEKEASHDISDWVSDTNTDNMMRPQVFQMFTDVREVYINLLSGIGTRCYPLSLFSLLTVIEGTSVNKVTIYIGSIIAYALSSSPSFLSIEQRFKSKQFAIIVDGMYLRINKLRGF